MNVKALLNRIAQLEQLARPKIDDRRFAQLLAPARAAIAAKMETLRSENPKWFEPGGPAMLPPVFGDSSGDAHFCRDLTEGEIRDYRAWIEKHGGRAARVKLTAEEVARYS